ncbi:hypothetical protein DFO70_110165 [Cytobacillus firmus]|uniref:Uncharacterized protein n=2 Tax=Cytobacillus TaxID=2675230 RepID=A0A366JPP7_CYTFI|nr:MULTISPECIES: hypothetical protein [Cytobacillus]RBP90059.1 hypothetical protein DFO70_110165 [Cytobacillus firmus]TDX40507.1 hypothetical protein DFO72_109176 [Cytobacillus oceanisediminis]
MGVSQMFARKIIAASISGSLFAVVLGLILTDPFVGEASSAGEYFQGTILSIPFYLLYSFPVILVYGTLTSAVSDLLAFFISNRTNRKLELYISLILHLLFGSILFGVSLAAAVLFFITDYILRRKQFGSWRYALKSLGLPVFVWIVFMGGVYVIDASILKW